MLIYVPHLLSIADQGSGVAQYNVCVTTLRLHRITASPILIQVLVAVYVPFGQDFILG